MAVWTDLTQTHPLRSNDEQPPSQSLAEGVGKESIGVDATSVSISSFLLVPRSPADPIAGCLPDREQSLELAKTQNFPLPTASANRTSADGIGKTSARVIEQRPR